VRNKVQDILFLLFILVLNGNIFAEQTSSPKTWDISNGMISKRITFNSKQGLKVLAWKDLSTGHNFIDPQLDQCNEFQLSADKKSISGSSQDVSFKDSRRSELSDGTQTLELTFKAKTAPLNITVHYELAKDQPAIRQFLTITNTGNTNILLENLTISCGMITPGLERDLIAFGGYGEQPRETYFTGRVNDVLVMLENAKTGIGWAVLNEAPGNMRRTEVGQLGMWHPSFAAMYDTDLFPFQRTLAPQETFTTAGASVLFYQRNTAFDPHWRIPKYVRERIAHYKSEQNPNWIYNTWVPWFGAIDARTLENIIPLAASNGMNLLTIDEGWQTLLGQNDVSPERFPRGLEPLFSLATSQGMKRGLWYSVSLIDQNAKDYIEHPDWVCRDQNGMPRLSQGQGVVMCLASPYKYQVIDRLSEVIKKYSLDYVKLDLTTVFNTYGEEPGCFEQGHEHLAKRESSQRIYEALQLLGDTLHQRFPNLVIDYTFELWGEKHIIDYGLLRVADTDSLSNSGDDSNNEPGPLQVRTLLYQRGMAIPVETMLIGNLRGETPSWEEHVATAIGSGPIFFGDLAKQTNGDSAHYQDWIKRYQLLRSKVQINEGFFPLGSWKQPRSNQWDGFARLAHTGEGIIALFRNDSKTSTAHFVIPGFPSGDFTLSNWNDNVVQNISGADLAKGVTIAFSGAEKVKVMEIHKRQINH